MFGTIRKHSTWLWAFLILVMVLTLVFYFSPTAGSGGGPQTTGDFGSIDGVKISKADFVNAQAEAYLNHLLTTGMPPDSRSGYDPERETYQRLFFIKKIRDYNIHVDNESVAREARNILTQFGQGRPIPLETFEQQVLRPYTAEDFARYVRHQLALRQLVSVIGLGGDLVTPQEAERLYARENQETLAHVVLYSGSNYQMSVTTPAPAALREYFTNQVWAYQLPERVEVHYLALESSNFLEQVDKDLAAITNLNEIVEQQYQQQGTNSFADAKSPEEAKEQIRADMRKQRALYAAYQEAEGLIDTLYSKDPMRADDIVELAKAKGLDLKTTAPFDAQSNPAEFSGVSGNLGQLVFRLTQEEPFADRPVVGEDAVYVIALARRIPSEIPPFEQVSDRVLADYKRTQATTTARRAGNDFAKTLKDGLAAGKSLKEIAAEAHARTIELPPISLSTTNVPQLGTHVSLYQLHQVMSGVEPGQASDFSPTGDGGFIVYVDKRLPIDPEKMKADMPNFLRAVRQARRGEAINAWLQKEASESLRETRIMQQSSALPPQ